MQHNECEYKETLCISATHACLPGHFPGQPVVPGVVLLDQVAACLERQGHGVLNSLGTVKFRAPLLPGQEAEMHISVSDKRMRFRIERAGQVLASGDGEMA